MKIKDRRENEAVYQNQDIMIPFWAKVRRGGGAFADIECRLNEDLKRKQDSLL